MRTIYIIGMIVLLSAMMVMPASAEFEPCECDLFVHESDGPYAVHYAVRDASAGDTVCVYNGTYYIYYVRQPNITVNVKS
jgi:hypothetical protein